jgi:hypothetical protein
MTLSWNSPGAVEEKHVKPAGPALAVSVRNVMSVSENEDASV